MRLASAVLAGVSLIGLTACGADTEPAAPAATSAAAPSAAATSAATAVAEATTAAAAGNGDKAACEQATKVFASFQNAIVTLAQAGATEVSAADAKAMLTDLANGLTKASDGAGDEMAAALKANADAALKAAKDKDPVNALDTTETAKAGTELNAACKKAGVTTSF